MNWLLLKNSLALAAGTTVLATGLGLLAALCLAGLEVRTRRWSMILAIGVLALPPFLVTNSWLDLLGMNGLLHSWVPLNLYSLGGTVLLLTLSLWPISMFAALAAWQRLEPGHLESEPQLTGLKLCRWLLWPLARGSVGLAAILVFVLALNNFAVPAILQVKVLPAEMWVSFSTHLDALAALMVGWPMVVAPLILLLGLPARENRWPRFQATVSPRLFALQAGPALRITSLAATALLFLGALAMPVMQLVFSRRTWLELMPAVSAGTPALVNSVLNGVVAATVTAGASLWWACCAEALRATVRPARAARMHNLLLLPLFIPGIFLGLVLIWLFNKPGMTWFYSSTGVVILALSLRYLGLAWFGSRLAIGGTDAELRDSAVLEGANRWACFRHVQWPQVSAQIAAIWYAVYLLSLWDVETLVLILPPGGETIASRIFNLLHYGHSGQVNALCVWLLLVAVLPLAAWQVWRQRSSAVRIHLGLPAGSAVVAMLTLSSCGNKETSRNHPVQSPLFSHVEIIGSRGAGAGEFNKPRSLALDKDDNLFVVDMTGRVQKFSPDGRYLLAWQMPETDLGKAKGMCRDKAGNVVILEPHYQRVNHFTPEGKLVAQWGGHLTNGGPFSLPRSVAVNSRNEVIVSEYTLRERVQVFTPSGKERLVEIGRPGTSKGEFNRAEGVDVDARDRIYVADSCNHRVQVFSPGGQFLREHGKAGKMPGEFSYPYDVRLDKAGRQFVCEFGNSRITILDDQDKVVDVIGGPGSKPGEFFQPWAVAFDSKDNLYVADGGNHRVQKFVRK